MPWPTWRQRWLVGHPACWVWSWGGWRYQAGCCRSQRRWCRARWLSAKTTSWERVEAYTWEQGSESQQVEEEPSRAGCSAESLSGSTSWFYVLQGTKQAWTRMDEVSDTKIKQEQLDQLMVMLFCVIRVIDMYLPGSCLPSDTCGTDRLGSSSSWSCL